MDEFDNCSRCGYNVQLDNMEIFDSGNDSELICTGKCPICRTIIEKRYPLTKGDPT